MLSIASWRSGSKKEQEPQKVEKKIERVEKVVRRAAPVPPVPVPVPVRPAPSVILPTTPVVEGDHRGAPRRPASAMPSISGLTLSPHGAAATLVNISATGLLAESGVPLKIGNVVRVIFDGTFAPQTVEGRVVRTCVASMASNGVRYSIGIAFKVSIDLADEAAPQGHTDNRLATEAIAATPQPAVLVNRW